VHCFTSFSFNDKEVVVVGFPLKQSFKIQSTLASLANASPSRACIAAMNFSTCASNALRVFFIVLCAEQLEEERVAQSDEFFQNLSRFLSFCRPRVSPEKHTKKNKYYAMFTSMATTSCSLNGRLLGEDDDIFLFSSFLPRFSKAMSFRFFFVYTSFQKDPMNFIIREPSKVFWSPH